MLCSVLTFCKILVEIVWYFNTVKSLLSGKRRCQEVVFPCIFQSDDATALLKKAEPMGIPYHLQLQLWVLNQQSSMKMTASLLKTSHRQKQEAHFLPQHTPTHMHSWNCTSYTVILLWEEIPFTSLMTLLFLQAFRDMAFLPASCKTLGSTVIFFSGVSK